MNFALSCMPNTIYVPPVGARMLVSIIFRFCNPHRMFQPETMTSSCWPGQQWWRVHYSTDLDFQHRSSHWCHIQQDDHSAASPSLLIAVLYALPDILSYASSFHTDCAGDSLQPISIGKSQTLHTLSLQTAIRSAYLRLFLSCASSQFSSHEKFSSISSIIFDCWDTSTSSGLMLVSTMLEKRSKKDLPPQFCPC